MKSFKKYYICRKDMSMKEIPTKMGGYAIEKQYARPWHTDSREVYLIGVAFSSKTRCIEGWKIAKLE